MDELTQKEADRLIGMNKKFLNKNDIPLSDNFDIERELKSENSQEFFVLSLRQGRIDLRKITYNMRHKPGVPLVRLDLGDRIQHTNPDGVRIIGPHLHVYREGYSDSFAESVPNGHFKDADNFLKCLTVFLKFCNIEEIKVFNQKSLGGNYG